MKPLEDKGLLSRSPFLAFKYKRAYEKEHAEEFNIDGIVCFCGRQGKGKTLSAVKYMKDLKDTYPDITILSNSDSLVLDHIKFTGIEQLKSLDVKGSILFLDEITSQFNSLDSKTIPREWFTIINMMRKRRLHVVGTCPIFSRLSKAWREQFDYIYKCDTSFFGLRQYNEIYQNGFDNLLDDASDGTLDLVGIQKFWRIPQLYQMYDTYEIIKVRDQL